MLAIYKRELRSFFHGMMGYLLTAFLLAASGIYFLALNLGYGLTDFGYYTLYRTIFMLLLYFPVLAMRSLAEERHARTDQLLLTSPVSVWDIVVGKYLALCTVFALSCLADGIMIVVLWLLGGTTSACGANFAALLCYFLLGCAAIAVCEFCSGLTENQIIAAVMGFSALLLAYMMPSLRSMFNAGSAVALVVFTALSAGASLAVGLRTRSFTLGCFCFAALCAGLSALFLLRSAWLTEAFSAVLSALCLFAPFGDKTMKKFEKKSAGPLERLRLRSGIYASAVTVLVVVLAVLLNLIVRAVPTKYTEFDLSEAGLYTLSGSSKDIAHALTQDVTIYYLAETGSEDAIITKLLDRYASESSHIKWETKDPAVYPTFAAQYGVQSAENGSLILVSGEKSAVLAASDLYDYDYSDYYTTGSYSVTFGGENKLTAAIYRITSGEELHAYYTTNHGEQRLTDTLTDALEGQNLSVSPLDLLTDTIPDDCDLLIINDPQQDVASAGGLVDEMSALRAYLKNGGHLMLTTDSYYSTPNLDALMAEFGLTRTPGLVVEGDSGHYLNGYPYYLLPDYATDTESGTLDGIDTSRRVLLQMAQGITITETEGVTSEALLVSTKSSYSKAAGYEMTTAEQEDGDPDGPFALAAYASNNSTGAEVIWVNCGNMDNEAVYQTVPGNVTFLQGCAASLAGQEGTTLVESKALEAAPITISGHTAAVLGLVFVLILPAAVLAVGAVVVLLRRRK